MRFFICINFFSCFWQNSISWFSIISINLFSVSWCCGISSFQCSSLYVWFSVIFLLCIKFQLLKSDCFICFNESHLKMMKNTFYFILKVFPVLTVFKFLSRVFYHVKNGLIGKVNIKIYYVTTWEINNYKIHIGQYLKK